MIVKNFGSNEIKDYEYELDHGGKFVVFNYCVSIIFYTFHQSSGIYLVRGNQSAIIRGIGFTLISLLAGWWGIPWGPIYTVKSLFVNLKGGTDVTEEVMAFVHNQLNPRNQYF